MSSEIKITVKTERKVMLPSMPNFVRTSEDQAVDIAALAAQQKGGL